MDMRVLFFSTHVPLIFSFRLFCLLHLHVLIYLFIRFLWHPFVTFFLYNLSILFSSYHCLPFTLCFHFVHDIEPPPPPPPLYLFPYIFLTSLKSIWLIPVEQASRPPVPYLILHFASFYPPSFILSTYLPYIFSLSLSFLQALVAPTVVSTVRSFFGLWGPQSTTLIPSMKNVSTTTRASWGAWARARGRTQAPIATTTPVRPSRCLYNQLKSLIWAFIHFICCV